MEAPSRPFVAPRTVLRGRPYPLGATWDGSGVNFALYSEHAERVELCLFDPKGRREIERVELRDRTDFVWHAYLPDARPGLLYGYRVYGPFDPSSGHRFNPNKLLIDPYAKALQGRLRWADAVFGYRLGSPREDLSFDRRDNSRNIPKCRVVEPAFTWGEDRRPQTPWEETVIIELPVRGITIKHPDIEPLHRGTFAGLVSPAMIDYFVGLGVTAVELLPIHASIDDRHLLERGLVNYWGYNTIAFFAPDPRFLSTPSIAGFKTAVKRLHDAGIEVILDVVYNHTGEGNHLGPTLSFRGIDNASYYRLQADRRFYYDVTGTGNCMTRCGSTGWTSGPRLSIRLPSSLASCRSIPSGPSSSRISSGHHDVRPEDIVTRRLHGNLAAAAECGPQDFSELLLVPGVGARTVRALAQVAEVVHGAPYRFSDPARFSIAHGGKDRHPCR